MTLRLLSCAFAFITIFRMAAVAQPTVNAPTISAVTTTTATLGGTIAVGTSITAHGTAFKTSAGVAATDNPQNGGAVADGAIPFTFTQNRTGLTAGTRYFRRAFAAGTGGTGLFAADQVFLTEPNQPGSFTATATSDVQIDLAFPAASTLQGTGATVGYVIFRKTGSLPTVSLTDGVAPPADGTGDKIATITSTAATSFNNTLLTPGTHYFYTIVPFAWDNSSALTYNYNTTSPLSANDFTFSAVPGSQPVSFTATGISDTQIQLDFDALSTLTNPKAGYVILRKATTAPADFDNSIQDGVDPAALPLGAGVSLVTTITNTATTSFVDDDGGVNLAPQTRYFYAIYPFNFDGANAGTYNYFSTGNLADDARTFSLPPSGHAGSITASATATNSIDLAFPSITTAGITNADGYLIFRRAGSAPDFSGLANGSAPAGTYHIATINSTATNTYTDNSGLSAQTEYFYALIPFNFDGSNNSTYNYLTTVGYPQASDFTFSSQPSTRYNGGITATAISGSQIDLSFQSITSEGISNADGYIVIRKTSGIVNGDVAAYLDGQAPNGFALFEAIINSTSATTYSSTGLASNTTYYYALIPFNFDGTNNGTYNYNTATGFSTDNATTQPSVSVTEITGNLAAQPLFAGTVNKPLIGFSVQSPAINTLSTFIVTLADNPDRLTNFRMFRSLDATFDGGDTDMALAEVETLTQVSFPMAEALAAAVTEYFFVVADVDAAATNAINRTLSYTQSSFTFTTGTAATVSASRPYAFTAGATITPGSASACQGSFSTITNIVITEESPADVTSSPAGTYSFTLGFSGSGYVFDGSTAVVSFAGGGNLSVPVKVVDFSTIKVTYNVSGVNNPDAITISGVRVSTSSSGNPPVNIVRIANGSGTEAVITGFPIGKIVGSVTSGSAPSAPTVTFPGNDNTYCIGADLSLITVTASGGGTYNWYNDPALTSVAVSNNATPTAAALGFSSAVAGTFTKYATRVSGCESAATAFAITITPLPVADAGVDATINCSGTPILLGGAPTLNTPSIAGAYTYAWVDLTGNYVAAIPAVPNPSVTINNATASNQNHQFQVTITDANNCSDTDVKDLDVRPAIVVNLTSPTSLNFSPTGAAVSLDATPTGGIFFGVGVIQTGANQFKFSPPTAYNNSLALPQSFPLTYSVTDVNSCTVTNVSVGTFTLTATTFGTLAPEYCADEFPAPGAGVPLNVDLTAYNSVIGRVNDWNNNTRFYYAPLNTYPQWFFGPTYVPGNRVRYLNEIYQCIVPTPIFAFIPPTNTTYWVQIDILKAKFDGMVRNYSEGAYGGNNPPSQPTVVKTGATYNNGGATPTFNRYEFRTNPNYNNCATCNFGYIATYVEFQIPSEIVYALQAWYSFYFYYTGDLVSFGGQVYKCIVPTNSISYNQVPPAFPGQWQNVTNLNYDNGQYFHTEDVLGSGIFRSGFYHSGQSVNVNRNPQVSIAGGLTNGANLCQADLAGAGFDYNLIGNNGAIPSGFMEVSFDGGATWLKDGPSGNAILNTGINSGLATLNTLSSWNGVTAVTSGAVAWNSGTSYSLDKNILYAGQIYRSLQNGNLNKQPDIFPAFWELNSQSIMIRYVYDPGTNGSTAQPCNGIGIITVRLHGVPTVQFNGTTPADNAVFCYDDVPVTLTTNRTGLPLTTVTYAGLGIVDNNNGTGSFIPNVAKIPDLIQQVVPINAIYTDIYGCRKQINRNLIVNPQVTAGLSLPSAPPYCNEDTPFNLTGTAQTFTVAATPTPTTRSYSINFTNAANNPAVINAPGSNLYLFNPKTLYAGSRGSVDNSTQTFSVTYTETLTATKVCSNSTTQILAVKAPIFLDIVGLTGSPTICNNNPLVPSSSNIITYNGNVTGFGQYRLGDNATFPANLALNSALAVSAGDASINMLTAYGGSTDPNPIKQVFIEYSFQGAGCTAPATVVENFNISPPPALSFVLPTPLPNTAFCFDQSPTPGDVAIKTNTPVNTVITLSGLGVTDNTNGDGRFNATVAFQQFELASGVTLTADQPITIKARAVDNTFGCVTETPLTLISRILPSSSFTFANKTNYCYEDLPQLLNGAEANAKYDIIYRNTTAPVNYATVVAQPDFNFDPKVYFDDAVVKGANPLATLQFDLTYTSTAPTGCTHQIAPVTFNIAPSIPVEIAGVNDLEIYCSNEGTRSLIFSPPSGNFKINGVTEPISNGKYNFTPPIGGPAAGTTYEFFYTVITGNNCTNTSTKTINVLPSPVPLFTISPRCEGDLINFNALDPNGVNLPSTNYTWTFSDSVRMGNNLQHRFPGSSTYSVQLKVDYPPFTNGLVCQDSLRVDQIVGPFPAVDFKFSDVCELDNTEFVVSNNIPINRVNWNFGDGATSGGFGIISDPIAAPNSTGLFQKPSHNFPGTGNYSVVLIGKTADAFGGCETTQTRTVSILKKLSPSIAAPYFMNPLDGGKGFWVVEDPKGNATWEFGTPNGTTIKSTAQAWMTGVSVPYKADDNSYVNSPCFDLSGFTRPVFSITQWANTTQADGAVVQYSIDGGKIWNRLGIVVGQQASGINWYNAQSINANPGSQIGSSNGWSTDTQPDWAESRHSLNTVVNEPKVRFRVAFASTANSNINKDGFAFTDVKIENRNRTILAENFTNLTAAGAAANNSGFRNALGLVPQTELIGLQYHTSFPGEDLINKQNVVDPAARSAFYGVDRAPRGYIDGHTEGSFATSWFNNYFSLRSLVSSPIEITIAPPSANQSQLSGSATIKALQQIAAGLYAVHIAVIERQVGTEDFVIRKLLPSGSGTMLPTLAATAQFVVNYSWDVDASQVSDPAKLNIVVFVQEIQAGKDGDRSVLQAAINSTIPPLSVTTGIEPLLNSVSIYPNPADNEIIVKLPAAAPHKIELQLVDQVGKVVTKDSIGEGTSGKTISSRDLAAGIYILQIGSGKSGVVRKKVLVVHQE